MIEAPPAMGRSHAKQIEVAKIIKPLVDAVAEGKWLEFRHNDLMGSPFRGSNTTPAQT